MKRVNIYIIILAVVITAAYSWTLSRKGGQPSAVSKLLTNPPALAARNLMSQTERLKWLERNGEVPEDADNIDWELAKQTTWWGKPIDPKKFWEHKVLWSSVQARTEARRLGRFYPPIPYENLITSSIYGKDIVSSYGVEGPNFSFKMNNTENEFWSGFDHTHPEPPEEIKRAQETVDIDYFSNLSPKLKEILRNRPVKMNYPQEAFTEDALYWAYIQNSREYYKKYNDLPSGLAVDSKLITEPLTPEQLQKANVWKISYLQRLRREKTDEQYIQAYLKAWNLTENEVFGAK